MLSFNGFNVVLNEQPETDSGGINVTGIDVSVPGSIDALLATATADLTSLGLPSLGGLSL